jgi:Site-specific recombinase XerD
MNTNTAITRQHMDTAWLNYFRPADAMHAVISHIANLPSSKHEAHTMRVYKGGLSYFLAWAGHEQPTHDLLNHFIAHLKHEKPWGGDKLGISASSIASRYLAPLRIYLRSLAGQSINSRVDGTNLTVDDRHYITDIREQLRAAAAIPNPDPDETTNLSALEAHGTRLNLGELNALYALCDRGTLRGKRDLAMFYISFNSAMRAAEMTRITLSKIKRDGDVWLIHVRGKNNNMTPPALDQQGYDLLLEYIEAYNNLLAFDDPRRIGVDTPVWQQIQFNDKPFPVGYQGRDNQAGICTQSIRAICERYSGLLSSALNKHIDFTPHDMRRSYAKIMKDDGADIMDISMQLRHKSIATTQRYIGPKIDRVKGLLSARVTQSLPDAPAYHIPHAAG